jgi:hypothetical protein
VTVAVKGAVAAACTVAVGGVTNTERTFEGIVMVAEAVFEESETDVAVIVTLKPPEGEVAGAV